MIVSRAKLTGVSVMCNHQSAVGFKKKEASTTTS
jgi:hypothetical protein